MRTRDHPLYRRGRRIGWLDSLIVVLAFVVFGFAVRGVLA